MSLPQLVVRLNGEAIVTVGAFDPPCVRKVSRRVEPQAQVAFESAYGNLSTHSLNDLEGWAHFRVEVMETLATIPDCAVTASDVWVWEDQLRGNGTAVRFQRFYLPGAARDEDLTGRGMFWKGLHVKGFITPGSTRLSLVCDICRKTFTVESFHAGMMDFEYMYSGSGLYTLMIPPEAMGSLPGLAQMTAEALAAFEASAPAAPDGTGFRYYNPLRCRHCGAATIDFERFPEMRAGEYYGCIHLGTKAVYWT